jgi:hypothetical protein
MCLFSPGRRDGHFMYGSKGMANYIAWPSRVTQPVILYLQA